MISQASTSEKEAEYTTDRFGLSIHCIFSFHGQGYISIKVWWYIQEFLYLDLDLCVELQRMLIGKERVEIVMTSTIGVGGHILCRPWIDR